MAMHVQFTPVSRNSKTGPMPVSTTDETSCPSGCPLKKKGCFGDLGPVSLHWKKVTSGERSIEWEKFYRNVSALWPGTIWRHNQVGDLPHEEDEIEVEKTERLTEANKGRKGFTYTHHEVFNSAHNQAAIKAMNDGGFTVNLSADTMADADTKMALGIGPVVMVLPKKGPYPRTTPEGHRIVVCPAVTKKLNCQQCQLCQKVNRKSIVGLPSHGTRWKKVDILFNS